MGLIYRNFFAFLVANFVILSVSALIGGLAIGIVACVLMYAHLIRVRMPVLLQKHEGANGLAKIKAEYALHRVYFLYPFSTLIALFLINSLIYQSFQAGWSITDYLFHANQWFTAIMYDLIPGIRNNVDYAMERGSETAQLFELILSSYYFWVYVLCIPYVMSLKIIKKYTPLVMVSNQRRLNMKDILYICAMSSIFYFCYFMFVYAEGYDDLGFRGGGGRIQQ